MGVAWQGVNELPRGAPLEGNELREPGRASDTCDIGVPDRRCLEFLHARLAARCVAARSYTRARGAGNQGNGADGIVAERFSPVKG